MANIRFFCARQQQIVSHHSVESEAAIDGFCLSTHANGDGGLDGRTQGASF